RLPLVPPSHRGDHQVVLAIEVLVEGGLGHAGRGDHAIDADGAEPVPVEQLHGRRDQSLAARPGRVREAEQFRHRFWARLGHPGPRFDRLEPGEYAGGVPRVHCATLRPRLEYAQAGATGPRSDGRSPAGACSIKEFAMMYDMKNLSKFKKLGELA